MNSRARIVLVLLLSLAAAFLTACKTPESSENESSRPWNAPRQWETGLPGFQNERR